MSAVSYAAGIASHELIPAKHQLLGSSCTALQEGGQGFDSALRFSDAPSWEALEALVQARQQELGWQPPDPETVSGLLQLT